MKTFMYIDSLKEANKYSFDHVAIRGAQNVQGVCKNSFERNNPTNEFHKLLETLQ